MIFRNSKLNSAARIAVVFAMAVAINLLTISDASAQRGRGGGGGGARGGGGGGSRPQPQSSNRSPSMSRQSAPSQSRAARPATGAPSNRAAAGNNAAAGNRGGAPANRAGTPANRAGQAGNPSRGDLNSFLNVPSQGAAGAGGRAAGERAAGGNAAVNDFFSHDAAAATHSATATHDAGSAANQRSENIAGRTETRSDFRDSRGENREFASDNRQERVSGRGDNQAARVSDRGETRSTLAAGRGEDRSQRQQQRSEQADNIRNELENEFDSNHLFDDFWKNNPEAYYRFNQNPAFWTWATLGTMSAFCGGGTTSSSSSSEVYYEEGTVQDGEEQIPAEEYAAQAEQIVESAPEVAKPEEMEWLPLGVFVLAPNDGSDAAPNMFLQLAVSKEGIVAGTYNNKSTDETKSIEGMVDTKSGRAAWTLAGKNTPIMETKVSGLTENETNVLVHFADGTTQQWLMAHLEKPPETVADTPAEDK